MYGKLKNRPVLRQGQQSGCFVELVDGSLVLPFGHKDAGEGQKFILSYDGGRSFSNSVYDLHRGGLYASSVAVPLAAAPTTAVPAPANINISVKTAETSAIRVSWKIAKTFWLKNVLAQIQTFFIPQRRETGRPIPIQILRLIHSCSPEQVAAAASTQEEIATVYSCTGDSQSICPERAGLLTTLLWSPPSETEVARGGFFVPVQPDGARDPPAQWTERDA
eukprot:COSAG06_NODE_4293_length_4392_cov_13.850454_1_plen_221_part_00